MAEVPKETASVRCFAKLPILCSRGIVAGFYSTMDDALRANNSFKIKRLFEAAFAMPMRLRVGPTMLQVCLDSMTYSEDLWSVNSVSADSFFDFVAKVIALTGEESADGDLTSKQFQQICNALGVLGWYSRKP